MTSTRHDADTWDLASSVGATATMAATARAIATRTDRRLFADPFAEPLVRAVGVELLTQLASGEVAPGDLVEQVWIDVAKVRGKFYDDFFVNATNAGIAQVVILASGEGLLGYLLPEAQDSLLDKITELSAPGSRVATESEPNPRPGDEDETKERLDRLSERWRAESFDSDLTRLRYFGERNEAAPYLIDCGWSLSGTTIRDRLAANNLTPWKTTRCG
jgi:O-methyltransferase involved in polyketide biosynthesis